MSDLRWTGRQQLSQLSSHAYIAALAIGQANQPRERESIIVVAAWLSQTREGLCAHEANPCLSEFLNRFLPEKGQHQGGEKSFEELAQELQPIEEAFARLAQGITVSDTDNLRNWCLRLSQALQRYVQFMEFGAKK